MGKSCIYYDILLHISYSKPDVEHNLRNLAIHKEQNPDYTLPRIKTLLALPEFASVKAFMQQSSVDVGELQGMVDGFEQNLTD